MTPSAKQHKTKGRAKNFYWKEATPGERALKLLKEGDARGPARQDIKGECCVCGSQIKEGQEYRVFFNNNDWKGHETCIKSGGKNVAQLRKIPTTEDGQVRIFWDQLNKEDTALMLLQRGKTFTARSIKGLCCLCGGRLKAGEELISNKTQTRIAHKDEAKELAKKAEAKLIAEQRKAEQAVMSTVKPKEMPSDNSLRVAEETIEYAVSSSPPASAPTSPAVTEVLSGTISQSELAELRAEVARLQQRNTFLEGVYAACLALGGKSP